MLARLQPIGAGLVAVLVGVGGTVALVFVGVSALLPDRIRHVVLLSANEVGGDLRYRARSAAEFHKLMIGSELSREKILGGR